MGKSVRSKVMKRFRTCKRKVVAATIDIDRIRAANEKCTMIANGHHFEVKPPLNAFRYPNKAEAAFPKVIIAKPVDFRSEALPTAGSATCRNRRKKTTKGTVVVSVVDPTSNQMEM
jgi:hypothetical protein